MIIFKSQVVNSKLEENVWLLRISCWRFSLMILLLKMTAYP